MLQPLSPPRPSPHPTLLAMAFQPFWRLSSNCACPLLGKLRSSAPVRVSLVLRCLTGRSSDRPPVRLFALTVPPPSIPASPPASPPRPHPVHPSLAPASRSFPICATDAQQFDHGELDSMSITPEFLFGPENALKPKPIFLYLSLSREG